MKIVFDNLCHFGALTTFDIEFLSEHLHHRIYDKNEFLVREGQYSNRIYFVEYGLIHHYSPSGHTTWLLTDNDIVTCYDAVFDGQKAKENIQALEITSTYSIAKPELDLIKKQSPTFANVDGVIKDKYRIERDAYLEMQKGSPEERFEWFWENKLKFLNFANHNIIASYLGMSPVTLTRLKRENSKGV